jgi:hypothetical protein
VVIPSDGYLAEAQKLLHAHNALLIADEVQTGLCRTGEAISDMNVSNWRPVWSWCIVTEPRHLALSVEWPSARSPAHHTSKI